MAILQDLIVGVRNIRAELKVEPKEAAADRGFRRCRGSLAGGAQSRRPWSGWPTSRASALSEQSLAKAASARSTARFDVRVVYEQKIDVAAERERLNKELDKLDGELSARHGTVGQ